MYERILLFFTAFWGFVLVYGGLFQIYEKFGLTVGICGVFMTGLIMFAWLRETY